jgi:hypothetical protein
VNAHAHQVAWAKEMLDIPEIFGSYFDGQSCGGKVQREWDGCATKMLKQAVSVLEAPVWLEAPGGIDVVDGPNGIVVVVGPGGIDEAVTYEAYAGAVRSILEAVDQKRRSLLMQHVWCNVGFSIFLCCICSFVLMRQMQLKTLCSPWLLTPSWLHNLYTCRIRRGCMAHQCGVVWGGLWSEAALAFPMVFRLSMVLLYGRGGA